MKWQRAPILIRLLCLASSFGSFAAARYLLGISKAGIEDVPPPFILLAGLAAIAFLCVAVIGRYPWRRVGKADQSM